MILQRNISLLANRLHREHGAQRIPEAVLERDYCLAWLLAGLSQSKLRDLLIFKGGTALKRCHFGDYRFSEDLDFTLVRRVEFAEVRAGLEEVYELTAQASGIRFSFEAEDRQTHINSYTFYLRYQGPLPTSNTVKVDITVAEILIFPVEQLPVLRTYPEFEDVPEDRPISVYSLNEIATEKIVALQDRARNEPRDLYDLWFLTSHAGIKIGDLLGAIEEKLRFRELETGVSISALVISTDRRLSPQAHATTPHMVPGSIAKFSMMPSFSHFLQRALHERCGGVVSPYFPCRRQVSFTTITDLKRTI